ncbi:MAG: hypothetical protein AB1728_10745 [Bacteroidota bacterium]
MAQAGKTQSEEKKLLGIRKQKIIEFITPDSCHGSMDCRFIAFGSKPCGGPWEYLLFPASVDTTRLFIMISEYNKSEESYNKRWGILSDCSVPAPPDSVKCMNGKCTGYYFGSPKP